MSGKDIRLQKLFKGGKLFAVPMDHGITIGPVQGLTDMASVVSQVSRGGADAVIVHKGLVRQLAPVLEPGGCELVVHLSASTAMAPDGNRKELVASVEHALRLGATGVSVHINLAAPREAEMLRDFGAVAEQCDLWGVPLLAMMYVRDGSKESEYDPHKTKHAARVAEEIGADIIKVNYTGDVESFREVAGAVKVPVVIAGGPKLDSILDLFTMIDDAMQGGAQGVALGRNLFQDPEPEKLSRAIRQILDGQAPRSKLAELANSLSLPPAP